MPLFRYERVVGIVSSYDIRYRESSGYSLLFTSNRLVGAPRLDFANEYWTVLPQASEHDISAIDEANKRAADILEQKEFELPRDKIVKIIYDPPGEVFGGRVVFSSVGRGVEIKVTVITGWNSGALKTADTIRNSLLAFSPGKVYNERTGGSLSTPALAEPVPA